MTGQPHMEIRGRIEPPLAGGSPRPPFELGPWMVQVKEGEFMARHAGALGHEAARADFGPRLQRWADELSHRVSFPVRVRIESSAQVGGSGDRDIRTGDAGRGHDRIAELEVRDPAGEVREVTVAHAADAVALRTGMPLGPCPIGPAFEPLVAKLYAMRRAILEDSTNLVRETGAMAELVRSTPALSHLVSRELAHDIGFLANEADIGCYSRHPERHATEDLPADARLWLEGIGQDLVNAVGQVGAGGSAPRLGRGNHPPPAWVRDRLTRP